ncbi:MAG: hypothetical protein H0V17_17120 [Deltaproteobacteria bacterium]|nr:hypothetical protein [Deltaproteobacteria bacterium]
MRIAMLIAISLAACSGSSSTSVPSDEARKLLIDRNWLDVWPTSDRERLHVYRFVPTMGGGVYQDRTLYKGTFELFKFKATGDEIHFDLPETKTKVQSPYTIDAVTGPEPFDLRLTIFESPRGPKVYYGIKAETDPHGMQLEESLAKLRGE